MRRVGLGIVIVAVALAGTTLWAAAPACHLTVAADTLTVKDNVTGLLWQRDVPASSYDWSGAKTYCPTLNALNLGGFSSGWRLPSVKELQTIVDQRVPVPGPTIDSAAFPSTPGAWYWSSTPYAGGSSFAWGVNFNGGSSSGGVITGSYRVRCVR